MAEVLIDEDGARVVIIREYLPKDKNIELCNKFRADLPFTKKELILAGKKVLEPRRTFHCGDPDKEHGYNIVSFKLHPWNPDLKEIKDEIEEKFKVVINSCLVNEYQDGKDYIGYHSDKEAKGQIDIVVSLSLGGSRDFYFKRKKDGQVIKSTLNGGDLCFMYGRCQELFTHSIPKRAHADYRISLTFRELS